MSARPGRLSAWALVVVLGASAAATTARASESNAPATSPVLTEQLDRPGQHDQVPAGPSDTKQAVSELPPEFVLDELSDVQFALLEQEWAVTERAGKALLQAAGSFQSFGGVVVVDGVSPRVDFLFTDANEAIEFEESVSDEVSTRIVRFTEDELARQAKALASAWRDLNPGETTVSSAIDLDLQTVFLGVREELVVEARQTVEQLRSAIEAPVVVHATEIPTPAGCTNSSPREYCTDPMMTGSTIRKWSTTGPRCTMGFHVIASNGDRRFLTAAHCDYHGSGTFYHKGFGSWPVGTRIAEMMTTCPWSYCYGTDVQMVGLPDTQASDEILGYNYSDVDWARNSFHNELVCLSGAVSNEVRCGRVTNTAATWFESTSGFNAEGMKAAISAVQGDSGGPVVAGGTAVGILSNTSGYFSNMGDVMAHWNITWVD